MQAIGMKVHLSRGSIQGVMFKGAHSEETMQAPRPSQTVVNRAAGTSDLHVSLRHADDTILLRGFG